MRINRKAIAAVSITAGIAGALVLSAMPAQDLALAQAAQVMPVDDKKREGQAQHTAQRHEESHHQRIHGL